MLRRLTLTAVCIGLLAACSTGESAPPDSPTAEYDDSPTVLNIVAGSEQKLVLEQIVAPWCEDNGLTCNYTLKGSVDQARLLEGGTAPYDAFWFASSVFEQLGNEQRLLQDVQPMFITPVVFAGFQSEMERLGFVGRDVTIEEVLEAVESKETDVWVTNPTQSNSGATVLFGFLNYFAGNGPGEALTAEQLSTPEVQSGITRFVQAFDQTPPSTGTLMTECVANPDRCKTLFTYEALVIEQNEQLVAEGREPLIAVYPQGSLAISDAPLGFLPHGENAEKQQNFQALQDYLLSAPAQEQLLNLGRRPITSIGLSLVDAPAEVFNPDWGIQPTLREQPITYPTAAVIQQALDNYQTLYRTPVDVTYCLDGSGSMGDNGGWVGVEQAADLLFDPAQAEQYLLQVNADDRTTVIVFNEGVKAGPWTVDGNDAGKLLELAADVEEQGPDGGTGIYNCLGEAARQFGTDPGKGRKELVILMTDGQDTEGDSGGLADLRRLDIPVIAIGFSPEADATTLQRIADETNGAYISAGDDLVSALRQATGYK